MCGRYYRKADKQKIAEAFHAKLVDDGTPNPPWDYNVAPTTIQPIIRNSRDSNERELVSLRWGLIPFFTKDLKEVKGISTIVLGATEISGYPLTICRSGDTTRLCEPAYSRRTRMRVPLVYLRGALSGKRWTAARTFELPRPRRAVP